MLKISRLHAWIAGSALLAACALVIKTAFAVASFSPATQPVGYVAQDEVTNYNLKSGNEYLFRGEYGREHWNGGLLAYPADNLGNVDTAAPRWNAGEEISLQNYDTGRFIATMKDDGTPVPFRLANLSAAQQTALANSTGLVNFIRGDQSGEGTTYRDRISALGDIIHSRPYFVHDVTNPTVFVGANDGMLHAINASTPVTGGVRGGGSERWAYVPSMLLPKLPKLAVNPYVHDYFVDGQINIGMVDDGTRRMLVGGLGAGGKGLYALDITTLTAATENEVASKVMWEVSPAKRSYQTPNPSNAYINLGYTYGTVTLAKMRDLANPSSSILKDVVIIGNGYNDGQGDYSNCAPGASYSNCGGNYAAYLYIIDALSGNLIKAMKAGSNGTAANPNGLSTPSAIDVNGDGAVDRIYAGDLNGTMWKFDIETGTVGTALLVTDPAQPITMTPAVAAHPEGGYMVNFGTGKMLADADMTDTTVHFAYGVWDGPNASNAKRLDQELTERSFTLAGHTTRVRQVTSNQPIWNPNSADSHKYWRVPLPAGERILGEGSFIENGRFYFTAFNPTIQTTVPDTTTIVKGSNWLMELDYLTGSAKNDPFLDLSGDSELNDGDRIRYIASDPEVVATPGNLGKPILTTKGIPVGKFISIGVLSQPILVQLQSLNDTLFNQNPDVVVPPLILGQGVDNGHFDQDIYYGSGAATKATGSVRFNYAATNTARTVTLLVITAKGETVYSGAPGSKKPKELADFLDGKSSTNYVITKQNGAPSTITVQSKLSGAVWNGDITVTLVVVSGASPGYEITNLAGGVDATAGDSCTDCQAQDHIHQYDDKFDVTGVNFLNASSSAQNLFKAISTTTQFKVIAHNQYLSPAVKLHIGKPSYLFNVDAGYIRVKDFVTSSTLNVATLPTYVLASTATAPVLPIQSFAINMPVDALTAKDWWGNGDVRVGLHPTVYYCAYSSAGVNDGNMYRPVDPPANGVDGPGVNGWSSTSTPSNSTGARHNGALTFQIIAANTPNSALELNVPGRPEYGWRVKSAEFSKYVLAEYNTYWHHPNGKCYGDVGWTKAPGPDTGSSTAATKASGSTDPKIGDLGAGAGTVVDTTTTVVDNVTTTIITYSSGLTAKIVRTTNVDTGAVTIQTWDTNTSQTGEATTTQIIAETKGAVKSGGDERGMQVRTGRISWRELVAD